MLEVRDLTKTYRGGNDTLTVVKNISFALEAGASCAIVIQGPASASATSAALQSFLSAGLIARCLLTFILLIEFC